MSKKTFKVNDRFGDWLVINPYIKEQKNKALCICACGLEFFVMRTHLRTGASKRCSKCNIKNIKENPRGKTHGMSKTKVYKTWKQVRTRTLNPHGRDKIYYKGIKMSKEWQDSFENFLKDMGNPPDDGKRYSIGRIDNNGNYYKENCRWETDTQQANNTSRTHWITYNNETMSMADWARKLNKSYYVIRSRINYGWSIEDVFER